MYLLFAVLQSHLICRARSGQLYKISDSGNRSIRHLGPWDVCLLLEMNEIMPYSMVILMYTALVCWHCPQNGRYINCIGSLARVPLGIRKFDCTGSGVIAN